MAHREFTYIVTENDIKEDLAIKDIVRKRFSFSSRLRGRIKREGHIYINDNEIEAWKTPNIGDEIKVKLPLEKSHFKPQDIPISILYEDDDLLIINKQAGYIVHPTKGQYDNTIANGVAKYLEDSNQVFKLRFINRLDMDTSGVLLIGKNSNAQDKYMKEQAKGHVEKKYIALVDGIIAEESGVIDLPIALEGPDSPKRCIREDGKESQTEYKVIERFNKGSGYSLAELRLITGRTHQIRVHMSHIGHPVVGDPLYGKERIYLIKRQALHAARLVFKHPTSGKKLDISAPLPEDMSSLIESFEAR